MNNSGLAECKLADMSDRRKTHLLCNIRACVSVYLAQSRLWEQRKGERNEQEFKIRNRNTFVVFMAHHQTKLLFVDLQFRLLLIKWQRG